MMRVLHALSIAALLATANSAFACPIHSAFQASPTEAELISSLNEPILLNRDDSSQVQTLRLTQTANGPEPVLLNWSPGSLDEGMPTAEGVASYSWDELDVLPNVAASLDLPRLIVLVDDSGLPLFEIEHTGSNQTAMGIANHVSVEVAVDGFEDR